jgi:hypothetical protein
VVRRKGIHIPAANEAAINPNPRPERIPKESHPSLERVTLAKKMAQSWYFRGAPLALDALPGISGAGTT